MFRLTVIALALLLTIQPSVAINNVLRRVFRKSSHDAPLQSAMVETEMTSHMRKTSIAMSQIQRWGPSWGDDRGYVPGRELQFVKTEPNSRIRLSWYDNQRVYRDQSWSAARWEIRVDDKQCAPNIVGDLYENAANPHRHRIIMGYCDGLTLGSHVMKIYVTNVPGYDLFDSFTGWDSETTGWSMEAEEIPNDQITAITAVMPTTGIDEGALPGRVLDFVKKAGHTRLRIWYYDNMRTVGHDRCCRWSLKIDGNDCPTGGIAGDAYVTGNENVHRPRVVMGYCDNVPAGKHRLTAIVGANPMYAAYKGSDCFTGWGGNGDSTTVTMEVEELEASETTAITRYGPDDATDNGNLGTRVITFQKNYAQSVLRLFYSDNLRCLGDWKLCRWELLIDDKRCPSGFVGQSFYVVPGENAHRIHQVTGFCSGVPAGTRSMRVQVTVPWGGDAHTGWGSHQTSWTLEVKEIMPDEVNRLIRQVARDEATIEARKQAEALAVPIATKAGQDYGAKAGRDAAIAQENANYQATLKTAEEIAVAKGGEAGAAAGAKTGSEAGTKAGMAAASDVMNLATTTVGNLLNTAKQQITAATDATVSQTAQRTAEQAGSLAGIKAAQDEGIQHDAVVKQLANDVATQQATIAGQAAGRLAGDAAGREAGAKAATDVVTAAANAIDSKIQATKTALDESARTIGADVGARVGADAGVKAGRDAATKEYQQHDTVIKDQATKLAQEKAQAAGTEAGTKAGGEAGRLAAQDVVNSVAQKVTDDINKVAGAAKEAATQAASEAGAQAGKKAGEDVAKVSEANLMTAFDAAKKLIQDSSMKIVQDLGTQIATDKGTEAGAKAGAKEGEIIARQVAASAAKEAALQAGASAASQVVAGIQEKLRAELQAGMKDAEAAARKAAAEEADTVAKKAAKQAGQQVGADAGAKMAASVGAKAGQDAGALAGADAARKAELDIKAAVEAGRVKAEKATRVLAAQEAHKAAEEVSAKKAEEVAAKVASDVALRTATDTAKLAAIDQEKAHLPTVEQYARQEGEAAGVAAAKKLAEEIAVNAAKPVATDAGKKAGSLAAKQAGETVGSALLQKVQTELAAEKVSLQEEMKIVAKGAADEVAKAEAEKYGAEAGRKAGEAAAKATEKAALAAERQEAEKAVGEAKVKAMNEILASAREQIKKVALASMQGAEKDVLKDMLQEADASAKQTAIQASQEQEAKDVGPRLQHLEDMMTALEAALKTQSEVYMQKDVAMQAEKDGRPLEVSAGLEARLNAVEGRIRDLVTESTIPAAPAPTKSAAEQLADNLADKNTDKDADDLMASADAKPTSIKSSDEEEKAGPAPSEGDDSAADQEGDESSGDDSSAGEEATPDASAQPAQEDSGNAEESRGEETTEPAGEEEQGTPDITAAGSEEEQTTTPSL